MTVETPLAESTEATPQRLTHLPSQFTSSLQKYLYTCKLCLCHMLYLKTGALFSVKTRVTSPWVCEASFNPVQLTTLIKIPCC